MGLHRRGSLADPHQAPCRPMSASSKLQPPFSVRPPRRTRCGLSWASAEMRRVLLASTFDATGPRSSLPAHRGGRSSLLAAMASWFSQRMSPSRRWHQRSRLRDLAGGGVLAVSDGRDVDALRDATEACPGSLCCWLTTRRCCSTHPRNMSCSRCSSMLRGARALVIAGATTEWASTYRGITVEARRSRCGSSCRRAAQWTASCSACACQRQPTNAPAEVSCERRGASDPGDPR